MLIEGLSQTLTAQSWPGIRNEREAAGSRRRNGLKKAGFAAVCQASRRFFDGI